MSASIKWGATVVAAAVAEATACLAFWADYRGTALTLHLGAAVLASLMVFVAGKRQSAYHSGGASLVAFILVTTIPIAGFIGLLFSVLPAWNSSYQRTPESIIEFSLEQLADDLFEEVRPETQTVEQVLRTSERVEKRVAAVASLRRINSPEAGERLRLALKDPSDEVRLLAHAMLDQREHAIRRRIEETTVLMKNQLDTGKIEDDKRIIAAERSLAQDEWELVYLKFVSGEQATKTLQSARAHAQRAIAAEPDGATAILLSKIHMSLRDYDESARSIHVAEEQGVCHSVTAPIEAELAFRMRRFEDVKTRLVNASLVHLSRPRLAKVVAYWSRSE